jgi:hypothetical protein
MVLRPTVSEPWDDGWTESVRIPEEADGPLGESHCSGRSPVGLTHPLTPVRARLASGS